MKSRNGHIGIFVFLILVFTSQIQMSDTTLQSSSPNNPNPPDKRDRPLSVLVLLGEWFGDAYFPLKKEIEDRGWTMKRVGVDKEYRGCYNKKRDILLRSDILIPDMKDLSGFDCLIIPSGPQWRKFNQNPEVLQFVRDAHAAGLLIASFCVGNTTVRTAGLLDSLPESKLFPEQVTLVRERILLGPRGGGPPPGDGFNSAPIKEICDEITRELINKKDPGTLSPLKGPYLGQKPPGATPEVFAPGIVSSSEATEYGIAFAPEGKEFYFNRNGVGVMVCTWNDSGWTAPVKAPFLKKYKGGAVHIMADGKRLLLNRYPGTHDLKEGESGGIWALQKTEKSWDNPLFLITEGMRATSTLDGTIYTTDISGRKEGKDEGIIAKYVYSDSGYQRAADPDGGVNTENSEAHPFIAPDESYIIFDSTRPGGRGKGDLYICFRFANGSWSQSFNSTLLNTAESDWCATVSPDGKYLFFTRNGTGNGDIYWVDAKIIENIKPKELRLGYQDILRAIQKGDVETVKAILSVNPDLAKTKDKWGRTPLHFAVDINNGEIIECLIGSGGLCCMNRKHGHLSI